MYHITITTVGKQKAGPIADIISGYKKRVSPYAKLIYTEIKEERFTKQGNKETIKKTEAERIIESLNPQSTTILLSEHGRTFDSPTFSKNLQKWSENGTKHLQFVVAGPLGIPKSLIDSFDHVLSLSPLTFPHEIASLLLHEQLYRAITIEKGKTYHY